MTPTFPDRTPADEPTDEPLYVIVANDAADDADSIDRDSGSRGVLDIGPTFGPAIDQIKQRLGNRVPLDAQALKSSMGGLLRVVGDVFEQASNQTGLDLDTVKLTVEINSKSQVSLVGTGGELGGKGAIELTFKKKP